LFLIKIEFELDLDFFYKLNLIRYPE